MAKITIDVYKQFDKCGDEYLQDEHIPVTFSISFSSDGNLILEIDDKDALFIINKNDLDIVKKLLS